MIRRAQDGDGAALARCAHRAYAGYVPRLQGAPLPPLEADYEDEIRQWPTWVLEVDGQIVGGLIMDFDEHASISNVFVDPAAQGTGLGRRLLTFGEGEARRRGYTDLHLATHVLLGENVEVYEHLGWKETGRDATRVFMAKSLGSSSSS